MLRLYSDSYEREHFPVIIESSDSRFYTKEVYEMMHAAYNTYGVVELYGLQQEMLDTHYNAFFSVKEVKILKNIVGLNPETWGKLIKSISEDRTITF